MIKIQDVENTTVNMVDSAFPRPNDSAELDWDRYTPPPEYIACLVQISTKDGNLIKFHGLPLDATEQPSVECSVDLNDMNHVWNRAPSTLDNWDKDNNNCALLFLSQSYLNANPTLAVAEGGCGKYPCAAGDVRKDPVYLALKQKYTLLQGTTQSFIAQLDGATKATAQSTFAGIL